MTAHPTEARRRTTIDKLARIFGVLRELDERRTRRRRPTRAAGCSPPCRSCGARRAARRRARPCSTRCAAGLIHFTSTLADVVPAHLPRPRGGASPSSTRTRDRSSVPPLLQLRLVDRRRPRRQPVRHAGDDGGGAGAHARAVPALPRGARRAARRPAVAVRARSPAPRPRLRADPGRAAASASPQLAERLAALQPRGALPARADASCASASARRAERADGGYAEPAELLADLRTVEALAAARAAAASPPAGDLHDVIRQVEVFGFHFARLDIREHAAATATRWTRSSARSASARTTRACPSRAARAARGRRSPTAGR